uniref:Ig-like domain-containing protein n=1 Tax=Periophthalmus magnuspinnatus TaxID=409849 RepID=A0A3B3ZLQ9_9GOBI
MNWAIQINWPLVQAQSLTSSEPVVTSPGQSVSLSCKVTGLPLAWLHWIRQKPERGLEWIGRIDSGTGTIFAQNVQGQFSITKDTSTSTVYLQFNSAKEGDTAVYYCARETPWCRGLHSCTKTEMTEQKFIQNIFTSSKQNYILTHV